MTMYHGSNSREMTQDELEYVRSNGLMLCPTCKKDMKLLVVQERKSKSEFYCEPCNVSLMVGVDISLG